MHSHIHCKFMKLIRQLMIALLVLALPLQALAAHAPMMACAEIAAVSGHGDHQNHAVPADAGKSDHHSTPQQHEHGAPDNSSHSCCHHVFSGATPAIVLHTPDAPRDITPRISLLSTLFIPELPQRPPRV